MEFTVEMGAGGFVLLVLGALVVGIAAQFIGDVALGYEWIVTGIAAFAGAFVLSEFVIDYRTVEPVWDGVALWPALIGGLVTGAVVDLVTRFLTGGSWLRGPRAAA